MSNGILYRLYFNEVHYALPSSLHVHVIRYNLCRYYFAMLPLELLFEKINLAVHSRYIVPSINY